MFIEIAQLPAILEQLRKIRTIGLRTVSYEGDILQSPMSFSTSSPLPEDESSQRVKNKHYEVNLLINAAENLIQDKQLEKDFQKQFFTGEMVFNLAEVANYLWTYNLFQFVTSKIDGKDADGIHSLAYHWNKRAIFPFDAAINALIKTQDGRKMVETYWEANFPNDPEFRKRIPEVSIPEKPISKKPLKLQSKFKNRGGPKQ